MPVLYQIFQPYLLLLRPNVGLHFVWFHSLPAPRFSLVSSANTIWGKQFLLPFHHHQHIWHVSDFVFRHLFFFPWWEEETDSRIQTISSGDYVNRCSVSWSISKGHTSHWEVINQLFYCQHFLPAHLLMWTPCTVTWPICTLSSSKTHSTSMHMQQS